jgi:DNA-binding MarR family transcriptional regulator
MDFERDTSLGYLVNHLARLLARQLESKIKPHGIALGAFPALLHLWEKDGLTQKELVERLGIEQPTMAATLSRMERDGLITRQRDEGDARVQRIRLTESARELQDVALASATEVNAKALANISPEDQQNLIRLMSRVIATLEGPAA